MPSGNTLPAELYREIFQHISKQDLCVLSRTSRTLQADAEFFIYQHIESSRRPETAQFCSLITKRARLHSFVRTLHLSNEDDPNVGSVEYWMGISRLLGCLTHLEELRIYDSLENPNAWVLNNCMARLSKIGCDFLMDEDLACFLQSQVSLRHIDWTNSAPEPHWNEVGIWIPENSQVAPSTTRLSTNSAPFALKLLVSSPSLTHLWIYGHCAPPVEDGGWLHFLEEFKGVGGLRSLRLNLPHSRVDLVRILEHLSKHALNLRSLGFLPWFNAKVRVVLGPRAPYFTLTQ